MIPFKEKLRDILYQHNITITRFCEDTGINRANFFYRKHESHAHCRYIYMAIAYYLGMDVEDLIDGTDGELEWYKDEV